MGRGADYFEQQNNILPICQKRSVPGVLIDVNTGERTLEYKVSSFPTISEWAKIVDNGVVRGRQALWLEIQYENRCFYVVEWEGKKNQFGIYCMKLNYGQHSSIEELQLVMKEWAKSKDVRKSDGLGRGWVRKSIQHPSAEVRGNLPWLIAQRIKRKILGF